MSLRDRLDKTTAQTVKTIKQEEKKPRVDYVQTHEEPQIPSSLGILEALLSADDLSAIYVNGAKNIYAQKKGKIYKTTTTFIDDNQLEAIIRKNAKDNNIEIDDNNPFVKFNYRDGVNVAAILPPLSNPISMFVKCYKDKYASLQLFQETQIVSKEIALFLEALACAKCNILIAGEKDTFKTTLLSAIAKKVPACDRAALFDIQNEMYKINKNFTTYDFLNSENEELKKQLVNSIVDSSFDKIFINDDDQEILSYFINKILDGYKGISSTVTAKNPQAAVDKVIKMIMKQNPHFDYKKAKSVFCEAFDIIIMLEKDENSKRKIASISQFSLSDENNLTEEIFYLNNLREYCSSGVVPEIYQDIKNSSVGVNIFDKNYKHTNYKTYNDDVLSKFGKKSKDDILKKFKKELPSVAEKKVETNGEELMRKAQEKLDELKKNIQAQKQEENTTFAQDEQSELQQNDVELFEIAQEANDAADFEQNQDTIEETSQNDNTEENL